MRKARLFCLALLVTASIGHPGRAADRKDTTLIVIPVRYTVVKFAFDIARIRPVHLVAYDKGVGDEPLLLHQWDATEGDWKPDDVAAYQSGDLFAAKPKYAFLVGTDADLPAEIANGSGWCNDVTRIPSLKVIDMANTMNAKLKFSMWEWKKLAKRHGLQLVDDNAERRRYGRYGKPGTEPTRPRKVNPLLARLRRSKQQAPADTPTVVEEKTEAALLERESSVEEPAWSPAEEKGQETPTAIVEESPAEGDASEPPVSEEAETPAEDK